jgi:CheY-like chemotaxis protein
MSHFLIPAANIIGVMEDDSRTLEDIKNILRSHGYKTKLIKNANEAAQLARTGAVTQYILDINMGQRRSQEGITALERIKAENRAMYVAIYSSYRERNERMAMELEANMFRQKTSDSIRDIGIIVKHMLEYISDQINMSKERVASQLIKDSQISPSPIQENSEDENIIAYEKLKAIPTWFQQYLGNYVAFVGVRWGRYKQNKPLRTSRKTISRLSSILRKS